MSEKPILFSGEMVNAILAGRKTQTRRVIKPQPEKNYTGFWYPSASHKNALVYETENSVKRWLLKSFESPYGRPGDRLWVRETWGISGCAHDQRIWFKADSPHGLRYPDNAPLLFEWRPSIHMPRWASRITLEVVDVRVERVQNISEEDAMAEGINCDPATISKLKDRYSRFPWRDAYANLWDSLNAKRGFGWDVNPWVWVIEFRRVDER